VAAAVFWALQNNGKRGGAPEELYSTDHQTTADGLAGLTPYLVPARTVALLRAGPRGHLRAIGYLIAGFALDRFGAQGVYLIVAVGTHAELLATCPIYLRLHEAHTQRLVA
jgi:hypothetical protein